MLGLPEYILYPLVSQALASSPGHTGVWPGYEASQASTHFHIPGVEFRPECIKIIYLLFLWVWNSPFYCQNCVGILGSRRVEVYFIHVCMYDMFFMTSCIKVLHMSQYKKR